MTKKIAILQSNYIPWKGYFDLINMVDEFVFYDEVQYTKNDWRNRNLIQTKQGIQWLSIPVQQSTLNQLIKDTKVADKRWNKKHWVTISQNYSKAQYFKEYKDILEDLYLGNTSNYLCEINYRFIMQINKLLGITTKIRFSSEFDLKEGQTEKLLGILDDSMATSYLSGPAAKGYIDEKLFNSKMNLEWMNYDRYPIYKQLNSPFCHGVSILDLILNKGPDSTQYMKSFGDNK